MRHATHTVDVNGRVVINANCYSIYMPYRLESRLNERVHWAAKARRTKQDRQVGCLATPAGVVLPVTIRLTRVAPRSLDTDNLAGAFKGIRDGVADKLRVKDNDPRVQWEYEQRTGRPKQYGVQLDIFYDP